MTDIDLVSALPPDDVIAFTCNKDGKITESSPNLQKLFPSDSDANNPNISHFQSPRLSDLISSGFASKNDFVISNTVIEIKNTQIDTSYFSVSIHSKGKALLLVSIVPVYGCNELINSQIHSQLQVLSATLKSISDFVIVLDKEGRFTEIHNPLAPQNETLFTSAFKPGRSFSEVGFPDDIVLLFDSAIDKAAMEDISQHFSFAVKAFGGELHYDATVSPLQSILGGFDGVTIVLRDITSNIKTQEKLKSSLKYYLRVFDNFPNPIWRVSAQGNVDYYNQTWVEFTGQNPEEHHGIGWKKGIFTDDLLMVEEIIGKNFGTRKSFSIEYRLVHKSGKYKWVKTIYQPLMDLKDRFTGYIASCFDISDIHEAQAQLQKSESRYRAIVQEQNDMVIRWRSDFSITFANNSFCALFQLNATEIEGKTWSALFPPAQFIIIQPYLHTLIERGSIETFELEMGNNPEGLRTIEWLNSPVSDEMGNTIEFQSVGRDVTDKIQKEKENLNLLAQLNDKIKELSLINKISGYINDGIPEGLLFKNLVHDILTHFEQSNVVFSEIAYHKNRYYTGESTGSLAVIKSRYSFGVENQGQILITRIGKNSSDDYSENERFLLATICEMLTSYIQRIETDKKLIVSEIRYSELFENAMDIIFSVDKDGKIMEINSAAERILGYPTFEDINLWDLVAPSEKTGIYSILKRTVDKKLSSFTFESKVLAFNGDMISLQFGGLIKYDEDDLPEEIFGIARDITEQRRLEQSIMKTVIATEEKERKRFAEDLHDGIGPLLSGLKMYLQQDTLTKDVNPRQQKVLTYCREIVDDAISQTRSIANNLTPGVLNDFGLEKALLGHVAKINAIGKFTVDMQIKTSLATVEADIALAVFRVISELINNALKHADCSLITILIDIKRNILALNYDDNGKGFDIKNIKPGSKDVKLGVNSIINRINSLNGTINYKSRVGDGVQVKIFIPLKG